MANTAFDDLWERIESASDNGLPRSISEASEAYDDLTLECSLIPSEAMDFLLRLFSNKRVLQARGIENFLLEINVDFCKYSQVQRDELLTILVKNVSQVADQLGRHSIGDLIARAYPEDAAFAVLHKMSNGDEAEKHTAFVGLDVMRKRVAKDDPLYGNIIQRWRELQA